MIHARYAGGAVRLGFLVGTRAGDTLRFRYAQLLEDGATATGHCESRIEELPDGRLRLHETWGGTPGRERHERRGGDTLTRWRGMRSAVRTAVRSVYIRPHST